MKVFFYASILLFINSCATVKTFPLKGQYPTTPIVFNSENSFDKTWDNLIDVFAQKGLSIKIIDRASGLIISSKSLLTASMEDKDGKLVNKDAFIAIPAYSAYGRRIPVSSSTTGPYATQAQTLANPVYGEWNVRIKANGKGSTINVNIINLTYDVYNSTLKMNTEKTLFEYKSTGNFEKILSDLIK